MRVGHLQRTVFISGLHDGASCSSTNAGSSTLGKKENRQETQERGRGPGVIALNGLRVISSAAMVGEKKAYLFTDGVLLVSPAIESLMATENLETLLAGVKVVKMPFAAFPPADAFTFGVTTQPP